MGSCNKLNAVYRAIKQRCLNPKNKNYKNYGGRGITICTEWLNNELTGRDKGRVSKGWVCFKEWALSNGYKEGLSIDRIDNNKGYSPSNCRWVTIATQNINTRRNHYISYKGKTQTLKQWCYELGLHYHTVVTRLCQRQWSIEKALEGKEFEK